MWYIDFGLCHASLVFKVTDPTGFSFAPRWVVKASKLLRDFHRFMVGSKWWLAFALVIGSVIALVLVFDSRGDGTATG